MKNTNKYHLKPVHENQGPADLEVEIQGRSFRLMGRFSGQLYKKASSLLENNPDSLPVLVGTGSADFVRHVVRESPGPVAAVDREHCILQMTGADKACLRNQVFLVDDPTPEQALAKLTTWQNEHGHRPFLPILIPSYLRIDQTYYKSVLSALEASTRYDFWARTRYRKFSGTVPRILLISSGYFLMGEIIAACRRLEIPHAFLNLENQEMGSDEFIREFLTRVLEFRPDFVFTINHLGVDREGVLMDLLSGMELPLASWFVDNPHLILYYYKNLASPYCAIFTWDHDNLKSLGQKGFENVEYLPLATDHERFFPGKNLPGFEHQARDVSFVGNSMVHKVGIRLEKVKKAAPDSPLLAAFPRLAEAFSSSSHALVSQMIRESFPLLAEAFDKLPDLQARLDLETLVTWEATRIYRKKCVAMLMDFHPLIVGDDGWHETFAQRTGWDYHPELNYYEDLPGFYAHSRINFNTTSAQMKGAVNQRVFDVPACGGFLLTDYRKQMEELLEPGKEVVCYHDFLEIPELIRFYLKNPGQRDRIVQQARQRILTQHTYDHRLKQLCARMKELYA